jgi:hypothetical protein
MTTTPDLTDYVDLSLYDVDAATLTTRAVAAAAAKFPGWVPREGNTEVVLIEALALQVVELAYAINRVPAAVVQALLGLFDVERDDGAPPTATATVTAIDATGYTIEAGTTFRLLLDDGTALLFTVDTNTDIPAASTEVDVAITGTDNTDIANGVPAGTPLDPITGGYFINTVELATPVADGTLPEDDLAWLNRGTARLARLSSTLVLPEHFTAAALEEADVTRATTIDLYDATAGSGAPGDHPGHISTYVYGAGALLSGGRRAEIEATMEAQAAAMLDVHVADPTINTVTVAATVHRLAGFTDADVKASVVTALDTYLDPDAWEWGATVYLNELIALLDGVDGVDRVTAVTIEGVAANFVLTGDAPLVDTDTVAADITVTS